MGQNVCHHTVLSKAVHVHDKCYILRCFLCLSFYVRVWVRDREITFSELCWCRECHRARDGSSLRKNLHQKGTSKWHQHGGEYEASWQRALHASALAQSQAVSRLWLWLCNASFARWTSRWSCLTNMKKPPWRRMSTMSLMPSRGLVSGHWRPKESSCDSSSQPLLIQSILVRTDLKLKTVIEFNYVERFLG